MELSVTQAIKYAIAWFYLFFMLFYVFPQVFSIFNVSLSIIHYILLGLLISSVFIYSAITGADLKLSYIFISPFAYVISYFLLNTLFTSLNLGSMWYTSEWWYPAISFFLTEIVPTLILIGMLLESAYYFDEEQTLLREILPF